jgi:hypothetical protein
MYRNRTSSRTRKLILGASAAVLAAGAFAVSTGLSNAGENCAGLDTALQNNLTFIAAQRADPDALSDARIANRQAVVDLINQRRTAAGCTGDVEAAPPVQEAPPAQEDEQAPPAPDEAQGDVVCRGSTVTLSGEAGAPFASSGTFPIGTTLRVTNLDNDKSITVTVETTSGSCVLLNNAAFEQVREPGKFLVRRAVIERVG